MTQPNVPAQLFRLCVFSMTRLLHAADAGKPVQVTHYNNPKLLAEVSENLGPAMVGLSMSVFLKRYHRCIVADGSAAMRISRAAIWLLVVIECPSMYRLN